MKKKMISLLLTAVMMVSLVCAITVSAYAEPTVTFVTVAQGDTVVGICKKYGVDYYSYKNLIMALNGVSSESDFSKIKIGSNFAVPISDAAAKALANCSASVTITPSNSQTAGSTAASSGSSAALKTTFAAFRRICGLRFIQNPSRIIVCREGFSA